jgi:hypothetical protein
MLLEARKPLHITDIIARARADRQLEWHRKSLVSALTKKVKSGRMFERVAANTFAVLDLSKENNHKS